jgi:hypothetical protein
MNTPYKIHMYCDWDDTILPTTLLTKCAKMQGIDNPLDIFVSDALRKELKILEKEALKFLIFAQRKSNFYIVTNASTGWFYKSCEKFLPGLQSIFKTIPIISARELYLKNKNSKNEDGTQWKYYAMQQILNSEKDADVYIVSIGDSSYEEHASTLIRDDISLETSYNSPLDVCTIKMVDSPTIQGLIKQLNLISLDFDIIIGQDNTHVQTLFLTNDLIIEDV